MQFEGDEDVHPVQQIGYSLIAGDEEMSLEDLAVRCEHRDGGLPLTQLESFSREDVGAVGRRANVVLSRHHAANRVQSEQMDRTVMQLEGDEGVLFVQKIGQSLIAGDEETSLEGLAFLVDHPDRQIFPGQRLAPDDIDHSSDIQITWNLIPKIYDKHR